MKWRALCRLRGLAWSAWAEALLVFGGCLFALAPLGYPGYIQPLAGFQPIYALHAWESAGHPLIFWPGPGSWAPFGGDGPLYLWLGRALRLLGLGGAAAVRAVLACSLLLGAGGAYALAARAGAKGWRAYTALVWSYSPAPLWAMYGFGAPGISLALGFSPWLALAVSGGLQAPAAFAVGLLAGFAHTGFAAVALVLLCLVGACLRRRRPDIWPLAGLAVPLITLAVGVGCGFLQAQPHPPLLARWDELLTPASPFAPSGSPWAAFARQSMDVGVLLVALYAWAALSSASQRSRTSVLGPLFVALGCVALWLPWAGKLWAVLGLVLPGVWPLVALASLTLFWSALELGGVALEQCWRSAGPALMLSAAVLAWPYLLPPVTPVEPASRPLGSFGEGRILLVRAELYGPLRHGAAPRLRLYWQATAPVTEDYTVFVHVVDASGNRWGQHDSFPAGGSAPTSSWRPGQVIADEHQLLIDLNGPRQGYRLLVGLYRWQDGMRLPLDGGGTELELGGD